LLFYIFRIIILISIFKAYSCNNYHFYFLEFHDICSIFYPQGFLKLILIFTCKARTIKIVFLHADFVHCLSQIYSPSVILYRNVCVNYVAMASAVVKFFNEVRHTNIQSTHNTLYSSQMATCFSPSSGS
jgi:hypothetical protein